MRRLLLLSLAVSLRAMEASAAISFIGAGAQNCSQTESASVSAPLPAGTQANDLAMVFVNGKSETATYVRPTAPTDFTWHGEELRDISGVQLGVVTYYKVLVGSDAGPTVTVPTSWSTASGITTNAVLCAATLVWRGTDTSTIFDTTDVESQSGAATTFTPTGLSTSTSNAWAAATCATGDDNALGFNAGNDQGFTLRASGAAYDTTVGADTSLVVADKLISSPSSVTEPTFEETVNGADSWVCIAMAIKAQTTGAKPNFLMMGLWGKP